MSVLGLFIKNNKIKKINKTTNHFAGEEGEDLFYIYLDIIYFRDPITFL